MFIEMKVAGITIDPLSNTPIVILKDAGGNNALPIWIGILEASAIATELGEVKPPRPMTHDLLKNILDDLSVVVDRVEVNDLRDNTFFATVYLTLLGENHAIDARPSDAMALALRTGSPIFVNETVLEKSRSVGSEKEEKVQTDAKDEAQKWREILENLAPDDFGKYKM